MPPRQNNISTPDLPPVPTPAPLLPTYRGQFLHLPQELLPFALPPNHPPLLLQIPILDWHILNRNVPLTGENILDTLREKAEVEGDTKYKHVYSNGLKGYCGISDAVLFLCSRRAGSRDFVTETPGKSTSITSTTGERISPTQVSAIHKALRTDFVCSPADSAHLPGRKNGLLKRVRRAERQVGELVAAGVVENLLASVQGGDDEDVRREAARGSLKEVWGYSLDGFYCGEGPEVRWKCLQAAVGELREDGIRVLSGGSGGMDEVLRAVGVGVDVVESGFPFEMAELGYALDLKRGNKVNCRERKWLRERGKVVEGCECGVCEGGFSRAYVRHLFEVHEMLGVTLLAAHNLWDYLVWFEKVRKAVSEGERGFEMFCGEWESLKATVRRGDK